MQCPLGRTLIEVELLLRARACAREICGARLEAHGVEHNVGDVVLRQGMDVVVKGCAQRGEKPFGDISVAKVDNYIAACGFGGAPQPAANPGEVTMWRSIGPPRCSSPSVLRR